MEVPAASKTLSGHTLCSPLLHLLYMHALWCLFEEVISSIAVLYAPAEDVMPQVSPWWRSSGSARKTLRGTGATSRAHALPDLGSTKGQGLTACP